MKVIDKEMYHIHKIGTYDEIWQEGKEIIIDDNYNSNFTNILLDIPAGVRTNNGDYSVLRRYIKEIIEQIYLEEKILELKKLSDEEFIKKCKYLNKVLWYSYIRLNNLALKNREEALEEVRKEKYPNLPSRYHCIWVCEKKQLEFWKDQLQIESNIYKVLLNGNIFKSSDEFLPNDGEYKKNQIKEADKYWNPVFKNEEEEEKAEYLFQGKVKILKKVEI